MPDSLARRLNQPPKVSISSGSPVTLYEAEDTAMKTLVESIAKALVDDPTQVNATEETEEDTLVISLNVAKEDMGRIIGKEGRTAKAIRTILNAVSTKDNKKAILKIVE